MVPCRKCLLREAAEERVLEAVREKVALIPEADRADDALYAARLEACKSCEQLLSGVCVKCGCYVEFRAAHRRMKCPNVRDRRW